MDRSKNIRHLIVVSVLVIISTALVLLLLENSSLVPDPASTQAGPIDWLMAWHVRVIAFLFSLIVVFMLYSLVVFRRRKGDDGDGAHFEGNTKLEIIWTVIPLITVLVFAYFGARSLNEVTAAAPEALEVDVTAQRYAWFFDYPELGIKNSPEMIVPVDRPLVLNITSIDVIHNFWVPEFRVKQDAVPGLIRELRIKPNVIGEYMIRCDELCGVLHHAMLATVRVVEPAEFDAWVAEQVAAAAAGPQLSEAAQRGQELTVNNGCTACHNVSGEPGGIGPTWKGLFGSEVQLADGGSVTADEDYIRSSIVNPNDQIHTGYPPGVMPQNYTDLFSEDQINDIVEYIRALTDEEQAAVAP